MQFTTLYGVGNTVWVLAVAQLTEHVTCSICGSTGEVTLSGETLRCPKCDGRKAPTGASQIRALSLVIDRVGACSSGAPCHVRYFGVREDGKHVTVMEAEVYATKELAEAAMEH